MPDPVSGVAAGSGVLSFLSQQDALGAQEDALKDAQGLSLEGLEQIKGIYNPAAQFYQNLAMQQMRNRAGQFDLYKQSINPYLMGGRYAQNQINMLMGMPQAGGYTRGNPYAPMMVSGAPTGGMRSPTTYSAGIMGG